MKHLKLTLSLSLIFFIFAGSIPRTDAVTTLAASADEQESDSPTSGGPQAKDGLQFRLSEGAGQA